MKRSASTVLGVCVFIGLHVSLAECTIQPREVALRISTAINKRQGLKCSDERANEIFQNLPNECISAVTNFDQCERQCFSVVCSDSCAQPFYGFLVECLDVPVIISAWELLCSRNKDGTLCYDTVTTLLEEAQSELEAACEDSTTISCSASCMDELEKSNSNTGCCLYTAVALATSQQETDEIWDACDVDAPGLCTSRFTGAPIKLSGSGAATVTSSSVLVVTLLMSFTSLAID